MKKLIGAALCAALLIPSGLVSAELLKNLKVSGGVDLRMTSSRNIQDFQSAPNQPNNPSTSNDRLGNAHTRTTVKMDWDLLDDVHSTVMLRKNDRSWGSTGAAGQGASGNQALVGGTQTSDIASNIYVQQANIAIDKVADMWKVTVGRMFYGEPGDLIIHFGYKPSYGLTVTSIDALTVAGSNMWADWTGIAGKTTGTAGLATTGADVDVRGLEFMLKNMPIAKVNPFVYNRVSHRTAALGTDLGKNDFLWVYGARLKAEMMGAWAKLDIGLNSGQNRVTTGGAAVANYTGKAILANVGTKIDLGSIGGVSPWGTFGFGTGRSNMTSNKNEEFTGIASSTRYGLIYGRFTNLDSATLGSGLGVAVDGVTGVSRTGLSNRVIWGFGTKMTPAAWQKLTAGISVWDFRYHRTPVAVTGNPNLIAQGNKHIGTELDITADWKHSDNVMFSLGIGSFQPGGYIKEIKNTAKAGVSPVSMAMADVSVKF